MITRHGLRRRIGSRTKVLAVTSLLLAAGTAGTAQADANAPQPRGSATVASTATSLTAVSGDKDAYTAAFTSPDWDKTPEGLVNKSCEHTIPRGATFDQAENRVVLASGAKERPFNRCAYPRLVAPAPARTAKAPSAASAFVPGWQAYSWWNSQQWLTGIASTFKVPSAPAVGGSQDFFFSSLEGAGPSIVQAVLRWQQNRWIVESEYNWNGGDVRGNIIDAAPGDTISTVVGASGCQSNGNCSWYIDGTDLRTNQVSYLSINAGQSFTSAQGGVMELYDMNGCNQLPASGNIDFRSISVYGSSHQQVTPSWTVDHNGDNKGYCGVYVDTSATETYMPW